MAKPTLLSKIFPGWAAARSRARLEWEALEASRAFTGAAVDRFSGDWITSGTSIEAELDDTTLESLRQRSQDLADNDAHGAAAVETMVSHVVGDRVRIQARCKPDELPLPPALRSVISPERADIANRHAERAFAEIAGSVDGFRQSFSELMELTFRQILVRGETLVHLGNRDRDRSALTTIATAIEPDRLMTPTDLIGEKRIKQGIEFDANDRPLRYYVAKEHPGDSGAVVLRSKDFDVIDAADIVHAFVVRRPGQIRGVPWFTPVLRQLRDKMKSQEARIKRERFAACIMAIIKTGQAVKVSDALATKNAGDKEKREHTMAPGRVWTLDSGQDVQAFDPKDGGEWVPGMHELLRSIGTALGIPYIILAHDFENTNYSSWRAAAAQMAGFVARWRWRLQHWIVDPFWSRVYDESVLAGMILAPGFRTRAFDYRQFRVQWPGRQLVDPWREMQADVLAVQSSLLPADFILAKYGLDYEEATRQIEKEWRLREDVGVPQMVDDGAEATGTDEDDRDLADLDDIRARRNGHGVTTA